MQCPPYVNYIGQFEIEVEIIEEIHLFKAK